MVHGTNRRRVLQYDEERAIDVIIVSLALGLSQVAVGELNVYDGDLNSGEIYYIESAPESGFESGYFLSVPAGECSGKRLGVFPNNTYGAFELGPAALKLDPDDYETYQQFRSYVAEFASLDLPVITPAFPRYSDVFTHAMTRQTFLTEVELASRVDLQTLAMVDDALDKLAQKGCHLDRKVVGYGFSAAGNFVTRLAALHPDRVAAVWAGGMSAMPILPIDHLQDEMATYPVGVGDMEALAGQAFDAEAFRQVGIYILQGAADDGDAISFRDSYSQSQEQLVMGLWGDDLLVRGQATADIYADAVDDFTYQLVPGLGHSRRGTTPDAIAFLQRYASSQPGAGSQ